ncbi:unnamed protein product [Rangifer tarandus platyrhynchus]|uniref:Uncharacterized protein n=1 Tax=Rangifer tarandus platyrhynchus TaxID=3082113 RepID=A0AC59Y0L4_RANTA
MSFLCQQIYLNLSYTRNEFLKKERKNRVPLTFLLSQTSTFFSPLFIIKTFPKRNQEMSFGSFFKKCIYFFWLHWVLVAALGLSLVVESGGCSSLWSLGSSLWWLLFLQGTVSRYTGFSSYSMQVQSL